MARYFFDHPSEFGPIACEGMDLASIDAARAVALQYAGAVVSEKKPSFWAYPNWAMTVSDAGRRALFTIRVTADDACNDTGALHATD